MRLAAGAPVSAVLPIFAAPKDAAFTLLFALLATTLLAVRTSSALTPLSVAAWRTTALVHAAEAAYVAAVALGVGEAGGRGVLPRDAGRWRAAAHGPALVFVGVVWANAALFAAVWLVKARDEARVLAEAAERRLLKAGALASEKNARDRVARAEAIASAREGKLD